MHAINIVAKGKNIVTVATGSNILSIKDLLFIILTPFFLIPPATCWHFY